MQQEDTILVPEITIHNLLPFPRFLNDLQLWTRTALLLLRDLFIKTLGVMWSLYDLKIKVKFIVKTSQNLYPTLVLILKQLYEPKFRPFHIHILLVLYRWNLRRHRWSKFLMTRQVSSLASSFNRWWNTHQPTEFIGDLIAVLSVWINEISESTACEYTELIKRANQRMLYFLNNHAIPFFFFFFFAPG